MPDSATTDRELSKRIAIETFLSDPMSFVLAYDLWKLPVPPKDFHRDWMLEAAKGRNLVLKAPKDFAKSTVFSFCFPIWIICHYPDVRLILASDTHSQAVRRTRSIKNELQGNPKLIRDFGSFVPRRGEGLLWSDEEFTVNQRRNRSLPDATMRALGMGDAIEGARVDGIICDDVCSLENQGTSDRRQKVKTWFFSPLLGCREKWTPVWAVGTRKHYGDLYSDLEDNPQYYCPTEWEEADYIDEDGVLRSRWPELWPDWRLQNLLDENRTAYHRDKRNKPMAPEDSPFPEIWLQRAREKGRDIAFDSARNLGLEYVVQAWDVAGQTSKEQAQLSKTAFYSCSTIGTTREGEILIAEIWRGRGLSPREWVRQVEVQYRRHHPDLVVVETNGQQRFFKDHAEEETFIPILAHNTTYVQKLQLKNREASLSLRLEKGVYIFPYQDLWHTRKEIDNLCLELEQFGTTKRSDAAMSLFMADSHLREAVSGGRLFGVLESDSPGNRTEEDNGSGHVIAHEGPDPWTGSEGPRPY